MRWRAISRAAALDRGLDLGRDVLLARLLLDLLLAHHQRLRVPLAGSIRSADGERHEDGDDREDEPRDQAAGVGRHLAGVHLVRCASAWSARARCTRKPTAPTTTTLNIVLASSISACGADHALEAGDGRELLEVGRMPRASAGLVLDHVGRDAGERRPPRTAAAAGRRRSASSRPSGRRWSRSRCRVRRPHDRVVERLARVDHIAGPAIGERREASRAGRAVELTSGLRAT